MDLYEEFLRLERQSAPSRHKAKRHQTGFVREREQQFGDFKCLHCALHVAADPLQAGVNNRNHCPYCLWSKHVDLLVSGDRLAACKGTMQPIGLTFKRRRKKYASAQPGELMLIHRCTACAALSLNRLAADDNPARLWDIYAASLAPAAWQVEAAAAGIDVLGEAERKLLPKRLFGAGEY